MTRGVRKLLTIADVRGDADVLEQLVGDLPELGVDAVALVGNLVAPWSNPAAYRAIFKTLGQAGRPAFWVPGPTDAPISEYLSESANLEIVYPFLHGVHGAFALQDEHVLFAGMGGEIVDDPGTIRSEDALLKYPGWEVEYRLKVVREFDEYQKVFLFTTRPAHKGLGVRQRGTRRAHQDVPAAARSGRRGRAGGGAAGEHARRLPWRPRRRPLRAGRSPRAGSRVHEGGRADGGLKAGNWVGRRKRNVAGSSGTSLLGEPRAVGAVQRAPAG